MKNMPTTADEIAEMIPSMEAPIRTTVELRGLATECGMDADDLPNYLAAMIGEGGAEAGRKRGQDMLDNKTPDLIVVHTETEKVLLETARAGLRASMRFVNCGDADILARLIASEIGGEHRYLQSTAANALIDALRLLCGRPERYYDARNEWMRKVAPKVEAIFD